MIFSAFEELKKSTYITKFQLSFKLPQKAFSFFMTYFNFFWYNKPHFEQNLHIESIRLENWEQIVYFKD